MADTRQDASSKLAGIDLSQFYQVFFEEAGENLESMEQMLLELDLVRADEEELNAIFRCAHSVKGGAATFGFADVAELTHEMETLLDKLRRRELAPNSAMVDALLASGDALKAMLARHQGGAGAAVDVHGLLATIRALVEGRDAPAAAVAAPVAPAAAPAQAPAQPPRTAARALELTVGPLPDPALADNLVELFQEITDLGTIEPLDGGQAAEGLRRFRVVTTTADSELIDLFSFHVAREHVRLKSADAGYGFHDDAPGAPPPIVPPDPGYGFFTDAPGAPDASAQAAAAPSASAAGAAAAAAAPARADKPAAGTPDSATLRVSVEKVDQLINLVGELVITQAMLAQTGKGVDSALYQQLSGGLADLGDLCLEGLDEPAAEAAIGAAAAAVAQRGALPLLLGGDSGLVGAALKGLSAQVGRTSPGADLALVQLGACDGVAPSGMPQVRLGRGGLVEASVPTAQTAPKTAAQGALSSDAPSAGPAQGVRDPAGPPPGAAQAASARLRAATQGRRVFVAFDLSVLAAPWHGMHDRAGFDGLGLRELRPLMTALGDLPLAGIALTGLDATRNGLSTVKTGQRLMLTALLDLLYRCLLPTRAAEPA